MGLVQQNNRYYQARNGIIMTTKLQRYIQNNTYKCLVWYGKCPRIFEGSWLKDHQPDNEILTMT